jgi:uncharacterized protein with HEPN domain
MRDERLYLQDIIDACSSIELFIAGLERDTVVSDDMIFSAVTRKLEIIVEAAAHISPLIRERHPEIDWTAIIGFRNILAHQYFASNPDIVWDAAETEAPILKTQIRAILAELDS